MSIVFNANEVFEMAKQIERNGAAFYRKAATINPAERTLLLEIAGQEDQHLATFQEMQKGLGGRETESTAFDPDNEGTLYLQAMAGAHVFDVRQDPSALLKGNESLAAILRTAIGLENASIAFYAGIREAVPRKLGADKIAAIIREEFKHVRWLAGKLRA